MDSKYLIPRFKILLKIQDYLSGPISVEIGKYAENDTNYVLRIRYTVGVAITRDVPGYAPIERHIRYRYGVCNYPLSISKIPNQIASFPGAKDAVA